MTDNQLGKIRNTGLAELVDGWCISDEVGVRKPDPKIFQLTAQRCGMRRRSATAGCGGATLSQRSTGVPTMDSSACAAEP
jgi:hypothetical protein